MSCTRFQAMGTPVSQLSNTACSWGVFARTCEWQVMHVSVAGTEAVFEVSTVVWQ